MDENINEPSQANRFELMNEGVVWNDNNVTLTMTIRDAECFSASTNSSFTVYLAAIDYDNKFCSWLPIQSKDFTYKEETGMRSFSGTFPGNLNGAMDLNDCFENLYHDCSPRADAIFIRFDNQPEDAWAIDQIIVETSFHLGPTDDYMETWHFEHPILVPCVSWLDDSLTYQIGPRNGLFITRSYRYQAKKWEWIRDWV
ncbi:hypothetical protein Y032_0417g1092 [Ancylostoma ceylanicum]|nr:hypothetical protein Y032_0417g1092 [Ancylostoma ceylanicum]